MRVRSDVGTEVRSTDSLILLLCKAKRVLGLPFTVQALSEEATLDFVHPGKR